MKQMNIPEEMQIRVDFQNSDLPRTVKELRPVLWHDGSAFCCLLGADPQVGIFGCGSTKEAAFFDWDKQLISRLRDARSDDELARYVLDTLKIKKEDVW